MNEITTASLVIAGTRRGRRSRAEAPSGVLAVKLSPGERQLVKDAATANRQRVSQFVRDAIVTAAEDCLEMRR